ncbi:MAG: protease modulator HflC [Limnobacter sp.]|jgi:modulator of FtsH protease HflC|uniref:Protein HflC n=2 Tax=Limnobacter TaxID=131079 RepID=A0ABX6N7D9_9BURK|nr:MULTISPECIES: protease modulator HflC [unclassified Limnobacter]MDZ4048746.1 protease modulator HflC [Limnobacter sp.]PQJ26061.1 HflC protein [Limnobacter sp. SAORIC-690]QJR29946.1 protease modulator HflC [Limnobacter sp. SAORIC-580]|tara:strand:- start:12382 stop:13248 length:867 start_codon:yes stop_codon:yes gene_type:complete
MPKIFVVVAAALIGFFVANTCLYVVDQRQYAIVFALGQVEEVRQEPGLYFKLPAPFQNVIFLDKRIQTIDTPEPERFITSEKKNLLIDSYIKWRIIDPRLYFVRLSGDSRLAQSRMSQVVKSALNEEITKRTVPQMVSGERTTVMNTVVEKVKDEAAEIGVEILDVRLKRVDLLPEVSESVFRRMEAERKRVANDLRATGAAEAEQIRADADRQVVVILAEAYREAQTIKGEGDAKAGSIYNAAFGRNPEFYSFYRSLDAYKKSLTSKSDVMVVDPQSDFFKFLQKTQ